LRSGPRSRPWRRRLRRWWRWFLYLRGHRGLGLTSRGKHHYRAQSNPCHVLLNFFHANCRSPHSGQSLNLSPPVADLNTEGHVR
jgi:hypothetical protein